ncbi:MAG: ATP-dependent Clp protease proteolytic subunit [Bacteroidetes bacterium 46-16]|nr:MAG: ATP-dependent Clp protease proteolytic subunit [Bacteroidetes bacterium 46-16]
MEQAEEKIYLSESYRLRSKLLEERKIFLWGPVEDSSSKRIVEQLLYLEAEQAALPIHLYINSPGGMVTGGNAIYDLMQAISSPVYTYCMGLAASMASILLSGGQKGNRYIYPMAEVMIHQPSMGSFQGHSADIEINARQVIKTKELSAAILAANCGQPKAKVLKDFDRDYWMNAEEALAYGIVDKIMPF